MSNNASGRDGWRVPASEASLATVSPIFDAMKQLTISPKVGCPCVTALPFPCLRPSYLFPVTPYLPSSLLSYSINPAILLI